jgi:hypothetical protein
MVTLPSKKFTRHKKILRKVGEIVWLYQTANK